jgi:hypothetical protein
VHIDGAELHRLNRWLFENGQMLGVQIHSHPTNAFHSETDDTYPIITTLGGMSIVVPHFGRNGLLGTGTVAYRLQSQGWVSLPDLALKKLLDVGG